MTTDSTKTECAEEQSNKDRPMKGIEEPHAHDVMYGRGGGTNHHPGNKRFRKVVEDNKLKYLKASRLDKAIVALELVRSWRNQDPPGRFLKEDKTTGLWHDVGDKKAREKTSQALRENAPELRKEQMDILEPLGNADDDGEGDAVVPAKQEDNIKNKTTQKKRETKKSKTGEGHDIGMKDKSEVELLGSSVLGRDASPVRPDSSQDPASENELPVVTTRQPSLSGDYDESLSDDLSVSISFERMDGDRGRSWGSGHSIVSGGSTGPHKVPPKGLLELLHQYEKGRQLGEQPPPRLHGALNMDRDHSFASSLTGCIVSREHDPDPLGRLGSGFWDCSTTTLSPARLPNEDQGRCLPLPDSSYIGDPDKRSFSPSNIEHVLMPQSRFSSDERPQSESSQTRGRRTLSGNSDHDLLISGIAHHVDPPQQDAIPPQHHATYAAFFDEDPVVFKMWASQLAADYEMAADVFGTTDKSSSSWIGQDHDPDRQSQLFPPAVSFQHGINRSSEGTGSRTGLNVFVDTDELLRREMPKRVASSCHEDERTMNCCYLVKRAALNNRDGSAASNALKARYVPQILNRSSVSVRDMDMLKDSMEQSTIGMLDDHKEGNSPKKQELATLNDHMALVSQSLCAANSTNIVVDPTSPVVGLEDEMNCNQRENRKGSTLEP